MVDAMNKMEIENKEKYQGKIFLKITNPKMN